MPFFDGSPALEVLLDALHRGAASARAAAVHALGRLDDERAGRALMEALRDDVFWVPTTRHARSPTGGTRTPWRRSTRRR